MLEKVPAASIKAALRNNIDGIQVNSLLTTKPWLVCKMVPVDNKDLSYVNCHTYGNTINYIIVISKSKKIKCSHNFHLGKIKKNWPGKKKLQVGKKLKTNLGDQKEHQSKAGRKCDRTALLGPTEQLLTGPTWNYVNSSPL